MKLEMTALCNILKDFYFQDGEYIWWRYAFTFNPYWGGRFFQVKVHTDIKKVSEKDVSFLSAFFCANRKAAEDSQLPDISQCYVDWLDCDCKMSVHVVLCTL